MISLTAELPPVSVSFEHTYFGFASGRLRYDCVTCKAQCCRGHGYSVNAGPERDAQVASNPLIRFFMTPCQSGAAHYHVGNCPPSCFFLTREDRCQIHLDHGPAAKPSTCRLFPFNNFTRVGPYLVVLPHPRLCPLEIVPPGQHDMLSDHQELLSAMSLRGVDAHIPSSTAPTTDLDALIAIERRIVDDSASKTSESDIGWVVAKQLVQQGSRADATLAREEVREFIAQLRNLLGIETAAEGHPDTLQALIALTPLIRAQLLFRRADAPADGFDVRLERVPFALAAFSQIVFLAREAGVPLTTYQGVMRLLLEFMPVLRLIACLDEVRAMRTDLMIDTRWVGEPSLQMPYAGIVKALIRRVQLKERLTLGEVVARNMESITTDRMAFLRHLTSRLSGRLTRIETPVPALAPLRHPKPALQHWILSNSSSEQIASLSGRRLP